MGKIVRESNPSEERTKNDGKAWGVRKPGAEFLSDAKIAKRMKPGMHGDGRGLYLHVTAPGAKSWILRTAVHGKRRDFGLGAYPMVSLALARQKAADMRAVARAGGDPGAERKKEALTFEQAARRLYASLLPTWTNDHFAKTWIASLEADVFPKIGARKVETITGADVLSVLSPIWTVKNGTAKKIKQRIAATFDWAKGHGHYDGGNPVDGVERALPQVKAKAEHHDAMPYADVPAFAKALAEREGTSARCLEFIIHTATRSGEARGARWSEVDTKAGVWTIPAERMKARQEHRVPLSPAALAVLEKVKGLDSDLIFPSVQRDKDGKGKMQSDMVFKALFTRMKVEGVTTHGFRSSFRDWAGEVARADREVAEAALAHTIGNAVERAYARSDLFERRRELMQQWSQFLAA